MDSKSSLNQRDILLLLAVKELVGGFAHEVAQPLNAIMIASQVVQLRLDRTGLPEQEKVFLGKKLGLISAQVNRAAKLIDSFRAFSSGRACNGGENDLSGLFERVYGLMAQQFISRGIEVSREFQEGIPKLGCESALVEGVVVQALAFARDFVQAISAWHEEHQVEYKREVLVRLIHANSGSAAHLSWGIGRVPEATKLKDAPTPLGLTMAGEIIGTVGGSVKTLDQSVLLTFP